MRSSLAKAAPALAIVFSFLALWGFIGAKADELLSNGGFEDGTAGWAWVGGTLEAVCGPAPVVEGDCAGRFESPTIIDPADRGDLQHELVPVQTGGSYKLSAFVLKDDPHVESVRMVVTCRDSNGQLIDPGCRLTKELTSNSPDYQLLSIGPFQIPPNAAMAAISFSVMWDSPGAEVYIDDVRFDGPPPAPTPTPYSPAPSATPTLAPGATASPPPTATRPATSTPAPSPTATKTPTPTPPGMAIGYLLNGGFEEANSAALVGWEKYGGTLQQTATHQRSGSFAAAYISDSDSTKWVYQPVHMLPDRLYVFEGYVLLDDPGVNEVFLRVSWYASDDASGSAVASVDSPERLSGGDPSFRYLTTGAMLAPLGTRSARVRVMLVPVSSARAAIYLDDMSLYEAPVDAPVNAAMPSVPVSEAPPEETAPQSLPAGHDTDSAADLVENPLPSPGTGLRQTKVLSGAVTDAEAAGPEPEIEGPQGTRSGGMGARAWAVIGAGLFALGGGVTVGAAFYRRRLPNKR